MTFSSIEQTHSVVRKVSIFRFVFLADRILSTVALMLQCCVSLSSCLLWRMYCG